MSLKSQGSDELILKPPDSNISISTADSSTSDTFLQKVIAERNTLRIQNDQLWKIIEKQRTIIQQLQKVSSKNSALLRQKMAENRNPKGLGVSVDFTSKQSSLEQESSEDLFLEPLSPTSLDSHTNEILFQIELSKRTSDLDSISDFISSTEHDSNSLIAHARTNSLDSERATNTILPEISSKTLRRSITSPLPLNLMKPSVIPPSEERITPTSYLNFSRPPRTNYPPSPLSLTEGVLDIPITNKIRAPLSPLFPSPIPISCKSEENTNGHSDDDYGIDVITESPSVSQEATNNTLRPRKPVSHHTKNMHSRLTLDEFGPDCIERNTLSQNSQEFDEKNDKSSDDVQTEEIHQIEPASPLVENPGTFDLNTEKGNDETSKDIEPLTHNLILTEHEHDEPTNNKLPSTLDTTLDSRLSFVVDGGDTKAVPSNEVCDTNQAAITDNTDHEPDISNIQQTIEETAPEDENHNNIEIPTLTKPELDNSTPKTLTPLSSQESFSISSHNMMSSTILDKALPNPSHYLQSASPAPHTDMDLNSSAKSSAINQGCKLTSLIGVDIRVTGSAVRINSNGKEILVFLIGVGKRSGLAKLHELWTVEKYYSDFLALDAKLKRTQPRSSVLRIGKLPDRNLFFTHAPSKVDQRKLALQKYLQHLISLNFSHNTDICEFLSTNIAKKVKTTERIMGIKEGYLTKRGKNFGGWKRRYFVLKSPIFEYYEAKDGSYLGSIKVSHCHISRQPSNAGIGDTPYRHALMIVEPKKNGSGVNRHILCADSDAERDEWVATLNFYTTNTSITPTPSISAVSEAESESSKSGSQTPAKKGGKLRKLIRNDSPNNPRRTNSPIPRTESPTPLSPIKSHGDVNHHYSHSLETNNLSHMTKASINYGATEASSLPDTAKSTHRKSFSFKERLLRSTSPPPPVPLLPINVDSISSDPSPLSPSLAKKSFGSSLISTKQNKEKELNTPRKRTPFGWGKKIFSGNDPKNREPLIPIFGSPLEKAVEASRINDGYELPAVVHRCIEYLDAKGAHKEEGIYRLSGSTSTVKMLKDKFNAEGDYNILKSGVYYDIHAVSGILKLYLRELPVSILTRSLHTEFLHVTDLLNRRERVNELGRLISTLPLANYTLLRCLMAHLIRIVQHSDVNKMTVRNIGIVFSPTLGVPAGVFSLLMTEFEYIFWVNDDGCAAPKKIEDAECEEDIKSRRVDEGDMVKVSTSHPESPIVLETSESMDSGIPEEETMQSTRRPPQIRTFLQDQIGRSNRNSVIYADSAPQEFVRMEKDLQGLNTGFECDEEDLYDLVNPTGASVSDTSYFIGSPEANECYLNLGGDSQSMNDSDYSDDDIENN
ncbi:Rho GTPase activating protein [Basidiobolus ranarum]|uniref:Rho GTPase activating protein n=1 Tax=Basidiobolus ranarum TaxID=34480 RepID=A0ABR2WS76_9FUNG